MIAYLLHEMPEAERTAFAERWFNEPELYERVQMAEAELLDEFARGNVSRAAETWLSAARVRFAVWNPL